MTESTLTLIVAIIGSNAFFGFLTFIIQFLVTRSDMKQNIVKRIDSLDDKTDKNKAELCRTHILRFADDLRNGIQHSEEYFRQQILDCDTYDHYCETHPDFSNGLTIVASRFIRSEFEKLYTQERKKENETT